MSDEQASRAGGIDRRQLLKAGAWAAPAILLATATPAASASGNIALKFTHLSAWYLWAGGDKIGMQVTTAIQGVGDPGASVTGISLVVTTTGEGLAATAPIIRTGAASWTTRRGARVPPNINFVFTYAGTLATGGSTGELLFDLTGLNNRLNGTPAKVFTGFASANGATSDTIVSPPATRYTSPDEPLPTIPRP